MGVSNTLPGSAQSNGMSSGASVIPIKGAEYRDLCINSENRYNLSSFGVNFPPHHSLPKASMNTG